MALRQNFAVLLLGLAFLSCVALDVKLPNDGGSLDFGTRPGRGLVDAGATVFDVRKFGAVADDKTNNAQAFIKTWVKACKSGGPAKVLIPRGTFLTQPVVFQGPCSGSVVVEVQGTVKASTDISDYPLPEWFLFETIDGLVITGGGTFDGQGDSAWKYNNCGQNSKCQLLPVSIKFRNVNNSVISNINSVNSKGFHMQLIDGNNLTAHNLNITAPDDSPNTDGIHLGRFNLVNISNSNIGTGDDCISMGDGTRNVSISNIVCGPGHGISIGSLGKYKDEQDVSGIFVTNCSLSNTTNGLRIKTWTASPPSQASNIVFEDIVMDRVGNPIIIDQNYGSKKGKTAKPPSNVKVSNVHFKNIKGTSVSNVAVTLDCSSAVPCEGIELFNIELSYQGSNAKNSSILTSCSNAKANFGGIVNLPNCL